ncbi:MAG: MFS transporter [Dichotomicrobium sp.]
MLARVAPITALLLGVALLQLGGGLQGTLLPIRAQVEAFTQLQLGTLGAAYFLGFVVGCYFGPWLVRNSGHIRTFTAMVALASALVLSHPLIIEPAFWFAIRAATGVCFAILYMVIESWLNERASNTTRGFVFAVYAIVSFGMLGLGQLLLPIASPSDYPLFLIASILVSIAAVPVALSRADQPKPIEVIHIRLGHLYRMSPVGLAGSFLVGAVGGCVWSLAPIFFAGAGASTQDIAVSMAVMILLGAVGQWPLGLISDRMDRRLVIAATAFLSALAGIALSAFGTGTGTFSLVLTGVFGFFSFPLYMLCVAHMNDSVAHDGFVEAASGLLLIWGAGAVVGPLVASNVMDAGGLSGLFYTTAALHVLLLGFTIYRLSRREARSAEERGAFIDAVRVGQTVSTVDVLAHEDGADSAPPAPPNEAEGQPPH